MEDVELVGMAAVLQFFSLALSLVERVQHLVLKRLRLLAKKALSACIEFK